MTRPTLAALSAALLLATSTACAMAASSASLAARHGLVEVNAHDETAEILFRGKQIAALAAAGASLFQITSTGEREFVIVQATYSGLNCRHFYVLLELLDDAAKVSEQFGACGDLGGAGFSGAEPVVHLTDSVHPEAGVASYQWSSKGVQLAFESPSVCGAVGFLARKNGKPIASALQGRQATGTGRLQFLSAPDPGCSMAGVFVVPGDRLSASLSLDAFVLVSYTNPKSGRRVEGWVTRERLSN